MSSASLPTDLWVDALIRRVLQAGAAAFVARKGDAQRGDILVKVVNLCGLAKLFRPRTTMDGERVFIELSAGQLGEDETAIDQYIQRECGFDGDLWLVEIEDPQMRSFLTENIIDPSDTLF